MMRIITILMSFMMAALIGCSETIMQPTEIQRDRDGVFIGKWNETNYGFKIQFLADGTYKSEDYGNGTWYTEGSNFFMEYIDSEDVKVSKSGFYEAYPSGRYTIIIVSLYDRKEADKFKDLKLTMDLE